MRCEGEMGLAKQSRLTHLRGLLGIGVMTGANGFDYLCGVAFPLEILLAHSFLDAVHFVLIPFPVTHSALLSLFQGCE